MSLYLNRVEISSMLLPGVKIDIEHAIASIFYCQIDNNSRCHATAKSKQIGDTVDQALSSESRLRDRTTACRTNWKMSPIGLWRMPAAQPPRAMNLGR